MTQDCKDALLAGIAGCVLVSLVMWPTLLELTSSWRMEPYQYAWLVLPMIVYLLGWHHRLADRPIRPQPDFTGAWWSCCCRMLGRCEPDEYRYWPTVRIHSGPAGHRDVNAGVEALLGLSLRWL